MKQYESYKSSGTPWIGDIPSHWEMKKLKYLLNIFGRIGFRGYTNQDIVGPGEGAITLSPSNIVEGKMDYSQCTYLSWEKYYESPEIMIENGDVIFVKTASIGKSALIENLPEKTTLNPQIVVFKGIEINKHLLAYLLQTPIIGAQVRLSTGGSTILTISQESIGNYCIPVPLPIEQEAIVAYLDKKCESIDKAIATQERRITLLTELKQSIITEAVTRGLNPNVPLKDSGIDWIGQIPEHWEVMPLKYTANKTGCCFIDGDWIESDVITDDGIRYITTGNVGVLEYREQGANFISEQTFYDLCCTEVFPGDILISRLNEPIGRACILPDLLCRVITSVDNVIFRPNTDLYDKIYLVYYLNNSRFTEHANLEARGATMHRMSRTMLGHQHIVVPPIAEQRAISAYLNKKCARIDSAISKAKREIKLLREFKQSAITEAVTGKIKVC